KRHAQFRSLPPCEHGCWKELDSSNSSDALLMNIFCYPPTLRSEAVRRLLGLGDAPQCVFGYKARVPLGGHKARDPRKTGRADRTEVDLLVSDVNGDSSSHS